MPKPKKFSKQMFAKIREKYNIVREKVGHDVITRYFRYNYPFRIVIETEEDLTKDDIVKLIPEKKIIYTDYGNPYLCTIPEDTIKVKKPTEDKIVVEGLGICVKTREG